MFGLLALKILWYLLLLARETLLMMGNLVEFDLNKWDLDLLILSFSFKTAVLIMEMVSSEARWFPAISICIWLTAPFRETSRYYLYILWIPVLDWYLKIKPKVLTWLGLLSWISFTDRICPWALFVFSCLLKWYQNLDFAITSFLANSLMA